MFPRSNADALVGPSQILHSLISGQDASSSQVKNERMSFTNPIIEPARLNAPPIKDDKVPRT